MKSLIIPILLVLTATSCGKKAKEKDSAQPDKSTQPSMGAIYFNSLIDIRTAIKNDDVPLLKDALSRGSGIDINQPIDNETLLILAIKNDSRQIRNYLIEEGANLEKTNFHKDTPLMVAIKKNRLNSVQVLLDLKVELEKTNLDGNTALHIAIKEKHDDLALLLLKNGAKVYATDADHKNAIILSEEFALPKTNEYIQNIILKVEVGAPDIASYRYILDTADVKALSSVIARHPKVIADYESINPLVILVDSKDMNSAYQSARLLLNNHVNVNGPEDADTTPLIKSIVSLKKGFASLFLKSNADTTIIDKDGKTALIHAVEANNLELVKLVLFYSDRKRSQNACRAAWSVHSKLETAEQRAINRKIILSLNCNFRDRFVKPENGN